MNTSSRFVVAIHVMAAMALKRGQACKSDELSWSVNTNPVVIRRIIGMLRNAGLVISQTGPDGGSRLGCSPDKISLLDIYQAVEGSELFRFHYAEPNCNCPVGAYVKNCLSSTFNEAEAAMKEVLRRKNLMRLTQEILDCSGISAKLAQGWTIEQVREHYVFREGKLVEKGEKTPSA
ncbi:MAG: Rrf2 family transcriptional regulator [bacterium]